MSLFSLLCCCWASGVVVGLVLLLLGLCCCCWACVVVIGPVLSLLAHCVVIVPAMLSFSSLHCHWACHIIQFTVSLLGSGIVVGLLRWRDDANEVCSVTCSVTVPQGSPSARASPSALYTLCHHLRPPKISPQPWTRGGANNRPCCI